MATLATARGSHDNSVVVCLPCSGSSYKQWTALAPLLDEIGGPHVPSKLLSFNYFGAGKSTPWPADATPLRLQHFIALVEMVLEANPGRLVHLVGHSLGGGIALEAAAHSSLLRDRLASVSVFEPNHFLLLEAALSAGMDQAVIREGHASVMAFVDKMVACGENDEWDDWGESFWDFWFEGSWSSLPPAVQEKLLRTTIPHGFHEIRSIKLAGGSRAAATLDGLASLDVPKRMWRSPRPGEGSRPCLDALQQILEARGFEAGVVPEGNHMAPVTHPETCLALVAKGLMAGPTMGKDRTA